MGGLEGFGSGASKVIGNKDEIAIEDFWVCEEIIVWSDAALKRRRIENNNALRVRTVDQGSEQSEKKRKREKCVMAGRTVIALIGKHVRQVLENYTGIAS